LSDGFLSSTTTSSRLLIAGVLPVAIGICQSCGQPSSEGYLASHYEELVNQTTPVDASNTSHTAVKRTDWSDSASWEFETKQTGPQYRDWLAAKMKGDFQILKSGDDELLLAKSMKGDTESVAVHFHSSGTSLKVRVEVSVHPD
jgi:hypothetical protein